MTAYAVCVLFSQKLPRILPPTLGLFSSPAAWTLQAVIPQQGGGDPRLARARSAFPVGLPSPTIKPGPPRAARGHRPLPAGLCRAGGLGVVLAGRGQPPEEVCRDRRPGLIGPGLNPVHPLREGGPTTRGASPVSWGPWWAVPYLGLKSWL